MTGPSPPSGVILKGPDYFIASSTSGERRNFRRDALQNGTGWAFMVILYTLHAQGFN
jgi:hypothetical protein